VKNNEWIEAMQEELRMIEKNDTWVLIDKPLHKKVIGVKWVYRTKQSQISCEELCSNVWSGLLRNICTSSTPRYNQITTCSVCIKEVYQLDVKSTFLHGSVRGDLHRTTKRL
jgi:hypothetical protein